MALIGLTGGIASGKSTIGRRLEELGAVRIDADQLAREAVEPGSRGLRLVEERFGEGVIREDGSLDRAALGAVVFGDAAALADLNAIVHPEVRTLAERYVSEARAADPDAIIVYEVPLLVESDTKLDWDLVVVADAPVETRVRRQVELRGLAEDEARRRVASQASDKERRAIADVIIDTGGDEARTLEQVDALWERVAQG